MADYLVTVPAALDPLIQAYAKAIGQDARSAVQGLVDAKLAALEQATRQQEEHKVKQAAERAPLATLREARTVLEKK